MDFITEETYDRLGLYADWLEQTEIRRDFCMARTVLVALGLKEEGLEPAKKGWFRFNGTFEVARLALGLKEYQAIDLFFFPYTDDQMAVYTCRSEEEKSWIAEWKKTRSFVKRRDLAVRVIRHYMNKWRQPQGDTDVQTPAPH